MKKRTIWLVVSCLMVAALVLASCAPAVPKVEEEEAQRVIKTKCFWEHASERRVPCIIISCPVTFPPHEVYGRMLSGMGVPDILGTEGTFSFFTT